MVLMCNCCFVSTDGPEYQESFVTSGVFSVTELVQVSRSKSSLLLALATKVIQFIVIPTLYVVVSITFSM